MNVNTHPGSMMLDARWSLATTDILGSISELKVLFDFPPNWAFSFAARNLESQ